MKRIRIQLLVIALCLAVTTSILGLSAYLTDSQDYSSKFHTIAGSDLGFSLDGKEYEDLTIKPGDKITLDVVASVDNPAGLYVFVDVKYSPEFEDITGFDEHWHPIKDKSTVYYYGTDNGTTKKNLALGSDGIGPDASIIKSVTLPQTANAGKEFYVTVDGYAISTENIPANATPADIYHMIVPATEDENGDDEDDNDVDNSDSAQDNGSETQNGGDQP